jgi:hypothetical protein
LGGAGRSRGEALAERVRVGLSALKARAGAGADRLKETSEELLRPQLLRQALAARERGNLEAAFWLLREELALRPHDERAVRTFWDVAAACGRIVPELKACVERAEHEAEREQARACLLRALRHSVDPRGGGLRPGLALRLFEEARTVDAETARRAARVALGSSELHEAKRARIEALLEALERGVHAGEAGARSAGESAGAAEPAAEALRVTEAAPVEIAEQGLVMRELASDRRARLDFRSIEAVAVAEVAGLAADPVLVIDLVLKPSAVGRRARHVLRMRGDAFDPAALAPGPDAGEALRSFLAELLGRTRAVPLPEPESALGIRPRGFASLADYEREVLGHLAR